MPLLSYNSKMKNRLRSLTGIKRTKKQRDSPAFKVISKFFFSCSNIVSHPLIIRIPGIQNIGTRYSLGFSQTLATIFPSVRLLHRPPPHTPKLSSVRWGRVVVVTSVFPPPPRIFYRGSGAMSASKQHYICHYDVR